LLRLTVELGPHDELDQLAALEVQLSNNLPLAF